MFEQHKFVQEMFAFKGRGLETPVSFTPKAVYQVSADKRAQPIYCRVGNPTGKFLYVILTRNGKRMRMFPCGGNAGINIPLVVIDECPAG